MAGLASFPVVSNITAFRSTLFRDEHNHDHTQEQRLRAWFGHKLISAVSIPANVAAVGVGCAGIALTSCTLGAFKVAVFAATLGNVEPKFSTGFIWTAKRTFSALLDTLQNGGELLYDTMDLTYQAFRVARWVLTAINIGCITHLISKALVFVCKRIEAGVAVTINDEMSLPNASLQVLSPLYTLNQEVIARSSLYKDQSLRHIAEHKALTIINIPANAAVAAVTCALSAAGIVAAVAKGIIYATTNQRIPFATGFIYTATLSLEACYNAARNVVDLGADAAVLLYKAANVLPIQKAVVTALQVVAYIPRAIIS